MTGASARLSFVPITTGFLAGGMLHTLVRLHGLKMPTNVFLPLIVTLSLAGSVAGAILAARSDRKTAPRIQWSEVLLLVLGAFAFCENAHVSMMYLVRAAGAPAFPPMDAGRHVAALALSMPASAVPFAVCSRLLCRALSDARRPARDYAAHLAAFVVGTILSYLAIRVVGAYVLLCSLTALFVLLLPSGKRQIAVAVPILLALSAYPALKSKKLFTWSVRDGRHLGTYWSDYHKMDFLEFMIGPDPCVAGIHNDFMLWYVCTNPLRDHLQRRQILKVVAAGRNDALVIGASGGVATQTLLESEPLLQRVVGIEIDEVIVSKFASDLGSYNNHVFGRPQTRLIAAEGRAFLDRTQEQFDLIFIDGIDNGTVQFPFAMLFAENYCFTREAYLRMFDHVLKPGGILAIDAGGIQKDLAQVFLAAMPPGVEARAFWYVVADYPMVELPLFFFLASRDARAIERMAGDIGGLGSVVPVPVGTLPDAFPTDDRPVLRDPSPHEGRGSLLFPLGVLACVWGLMSITTRLAGRHGPRLVWSGRWAAVAFGLCYALSETYLVTKFARFFLSGPASGTCFLISLFLAGGAVANLWVAHWREGWRLRFAPWLGTASLAASLAVLEPLGTAVPIGLCAVWVGFSAGLYWPALLRWVPPDGLSSVYAFMGVGFVLGSVASLFLLNTFGFHVYPRAAPLIGLAGALLWRPERPASSPETSALQRGQA
ncbi:MAG: hypothetical protein HYY13_09725 [Nitrospirae bacterium]|nr:hypothetical protein [Nitrospirota bacterium]